MPIPNYTPFDELFKRFPIIQKYEWNLSSCQEAVDRGFIDIIIDQDNSMILLHEESFLKLVQFLEDHERENNNEEENKE